MRETTLNMFRITLNHCSELVFFNPTLCISMRMCVSILNECLQMYIGIDLHPYIVVLIYPFKRSKLKF